MRRTSLRRLFLLAGMTCSLACSGGGAGNEQPSGGRSGSGDSVATGGAPATGGATGNGGSSASGGNSGTGGTQGTGGATAAGGTAGASAGGRTGTGGVTTTGGSVATGGRTGTGGSSATGGTTTGTSATGGSGGSASGGAGTGGRTGTGGSSATGGTTTGTTATGGTTGAGGSTHTGKWQIMPLGDSITETTCYPKLLAQELVSKGHGNFDFVGTTQNNQSCGSAPNVQTEGHSCYLVTNLVKDVTTVTGCGGTKGSLAELKAWAAEKPEVVLMQYGTNDAWSSIATQTILDAYSTVVDQFRSGNPTVIFFVAQITPLNPSGCATCEANVEALNAKIPTWASGKSTTASPIHVVNVWASLPAATYTPNSTYTADGCHPNPAGSQLMADAWYAGLVAQGIP